MLYSNFDFTEALFNALTDDGIIVMQLGQSPFHDNPPDELSQSRQRAKLINGLQEFGFQSMQTYEEVRIFVLDLLKSHIYISINLLTFMLMW